MYKTFLVKDSLPESYYEIRFKSNGKWHSGYYEHLWGGSFRAYSLFSKSSKFQKTISTENVTEWQYLAP